MASLVDLIADEIRNAGQAGLSHSDLMGKHSDLNPQAVLDVLNELLSQCRVKAAQDSLGETHFIVVPDEERQKLVTIDKNSMLLYRLVENSGRQGMWRKDLKGKSRLPDAEFNKCLTQLEQRSLIREFKSVTAKNKKMYILYNVTPANEHMGDIWVGGDGSEFDRVLVHHISLSMLNVIQAKGIMSVDDIKRAFVDNQEILKNGASLSERHVQQVLDLLKYEGVVEFIDDPKSAHGKLVKHIRVPNGTNHFTEMPCGSCPVYDLCGDVGDITPITCPYFQKWLEL